MIRTLSAAAIAVALTGQMVAGQAVAADIKLPSTMAVTAYGTTSSGYGQMVAVLTTVSVLAFVKTMEDGGPYRLEDGRVVLIARRERPQVLLARPCAFVRVRPRLRRLLMPERRISKGEVYGEVWVSGAAS